MKEYAAAAGHEIKRAICSWRFALLVCLGLIILYQPALYLEKVGDGFRNLSLIDAVMCASGLGYYTSSLALLSGLTYADSFAWEYTSGMFTYIIHREGRGRYIMSKLISTALSSGLLISLNVLLFCLVHVLIISPQMPTVVECKMVIRELQLLFTYGIAWSLAGLAVSSIVPNPVIAAVSPFCMAQFLWLLSAVLNLPMLNAKDTVFILNGTRLTPMMITLQEGIIITISTTVFSVKVWIRSLGK